jgi:hypothetical protein
MSHEMYDRALEAYKPEKEECKTLFDIYDFSYIARLKISVGSTREKEIALRHIYNYI